MTDSLYALVDELDTLFQSALDRMQEQARDAYVLEQALKRALADDSSASVLGWDIERAITPLAAYQALAHRIIRQMPTELGLAAPPEAHHYQDLLVWPDEPRRTDDIHKDFQRKIDYARKVTLRNFVDLIVARFAPDKAPATSSVCVARDLLRAFVVELPRDVVVPVQRNPDTIMVPLIIRRREHEVSWVMPIRTTQLVARTNYALATLARLTGKHVVAQRMGEMTHDFLQAMRRSFRQYEPNQTFYGGAEARIELAADCVDYTISPALYDLAHDVMARTDPKILFVPAETILSTVN